MQNKHFNQIHTNMFNLNIPQPPNTNINSLKKDLANSNFFERLFFDYNDYCSCNEPENNTFSTQFIDVGIFGKGLSTYSTCSNCSKKI